MSTYFFSNNNNNKQISQTSNLRVHLDNIRDFVFIQYGIRSEFYAFERHGLIGSDKAVHAFGSLYHVKRVRGQHLTVSTAGTLELLAGGHFDGSLAGDVGDEEVHGDVFTVHVVIHPLPDIAWHVVSIQITVILE